MTNETNTIAATYVEHFAAPLIAKAKAYDNADKKHGKTYATAMQRDDAAAVFGYCVKAVADADAAADAVETGKNDARRASLKKAGVECLADRELRNELGAYRKARKDCAIDCMTTDELKALLATIEKPITSARFAIGEILKGQRKANKAAGANGASGDTGENQDADATPDNATDAAPIERGELFAQFMDAWKNAGFGNTAEFWDWTATQEADKASEDKQAEQVKADKASGPTLPELQSIAG